MGTRKGKKAAGSIALATVEDVFSESANTISWRYDAFLANPDDPETLHKLRVSLRAARSMASFAQPWVKAKRLEALDAAMRKVVRKTSNLRELDVLAQEARSQCPHLPSLVELCENAALEERQRVQEALASDKTRKRLTFAADELHDVAWRKSARKALDEEALRDRFNELAKDATQEIANLDYADYAQVHKARKDVKRVRYVAERLGGLLGEKAAGIATSMKAQQDRLGAICDAHAGLILIEKLFERPEAQEPGDASPGLGVMAVHYRQAISNARKR